MPVTVPVLMPVMVNQSFDYLIEDVNGFDFEGRGAIDLAPGDFVVVPFGRQERIGVVWRKPIELVDEHGEIRSKPVDEAKLKAVIEKLPVPPLPDVSMAFAEWVANYTLSPVGMVLRMMMSARQGFKAETVRFGVALPSGKEGDGGGGHPTGLRMTPAREKVLSVLNGDFVWAKGNLAAEAGVSTAVINGMVKAGALIEAELAPSRQPQPRPHFQETNFNDDQAEAAERLRGMGQSRAFQVALLDGVTGSGKTEVYFEALAGALKAGRQTLVLLPEISLTNQFLDRFKERFGCRPATWHSAISEGERARIWRGVASGEVKAVIGARSALFLPYSDLGVIVVDEEHDPGYKQETNVLYHARDMAVVRGSIGKCAVVLASATPSLESLINASQGRYAHIKLKSRFHGSALPEMSAIDMRRDPPERGRWLSPLLVDEMRKTLASGEQSLLFLNRRGYAPLTLCRKCGHRFECPQCSSWLVEHKHKGGLSCHHCGFKLPPPKACPKCEAEDSLTPCGPGVERIAEEVRELFPEAEQALLSSDLVPNVTALKEVLETIHSGGAKIIIGTQIVAKGHNFPLLSTVGIVDGDLGLTGSGDPRAAERTFQLLHQVSGRAGRMGTKGRGFVQTYMPDHPVMAAILSGDRETFVAREIAARQMLTYPPYGRLVSMIVTAKSREMAELYAREVVKRAPRASQISVIGPVEAPIAVIRGRHRFRLLVKAPRELDMQAYLRHWQARLPKTQGDLRLTIDIDPYNFL
ncbi:MAG: primosomal protein N' [Rhodomicrobium sp.]|nr:MAG: primosomal protein N' [Rhodomicrobium sp.]